LIGLDTIYVNGTAIERFLYCEDMI